MGWNNHMGPPGQGYSGEGQVQNERILKSILVLIVVFLTVAACGKPQSGQDAEAKYVDESGEEVFGPGYRPTSPNIEAAALLVGTPNAGIRVPSDMKGKEHEVLLQSIGPRADPASADEPQSAPSIPLLRARSPDTGDVQPFDAALRDFKSTRELASAAPMHHTTDHDEEDDESSPIMTAHYVFVGQGDAAILEFPCGIAVIDTGGEFGGGARENGGQLFVDYLTEFFDERPHLNQTIDVLFTTHPHADHLNGLPLLLDDDDDPIFTIDNVVDNGQTGPSGSLGKQTNFRNAVVNNGGEYSAVELARQVAATGATNDVIDPIECDDVDPIITAFWGGLNDELPEDEMLSTSRYRNPNNHSLIVRVDYGEASFLFTGDLEDRGERDLLEQYADNLGVFDVDVYQVSHHGADDDTSDAFLDIMSPEVAVISMGTPDLETTHTAWDHGHPRTGLLSVLQDEPAVVLDFRVPAVNFPAAPAQETDYVDTTIERAILGTGWEGTIWIEATPEGDYQLYTE
jgi:beta-lactamase superfamily II metal-dependent hydrolase